MPNWCYTNVEFYGDREAISNLNRKINQAKELEKNPWIVDNVQFSKSNWLGNVVFEFGGKTCGRYLEDGKITPCVDKSVPEISCRGEVIYSDAHDGETLELEVMTAWAPTIDLFDHICNYYKRLGFYISYDYCAEEPGLGLYINTNPAIWPAIACLYIHDNEVNETHYVENRKQLSGILRKHGIIVKGDETIEKYEELLSNVSQNNINSDYYCSFATDEHGRYLIDMQ